MQVIQKTLWDFNQTACMSSVMCSGKKHMGGCTVWRLFLDLAKHLVAISVPTAHDKCVCRRNTHRWCLRGECGRGECVFSVLNKAQYVIIHETFSKREHFLFPGLLCAFVLVRVRASSSLLYCNVCTVLYTGIGHRCVFHSSIPFITV